MNLIQDIAAGSWPMTYREYARTFLVPAVLDDDSDDYGMLTPEGNAAVAGLIAATRCLVRAGCNEGDVNNWFSDGVEALRQGGHTEIHDTVVSESFVWLLDDVWLVAYGHGPGDAIRWGNAVMAELALECDEAPAEARANATTTTTIARESRCVDGTP